MALIESLAVEFLRLAEAEQFQQVLNARKRRDWRAEERKQKKSKKKSSTKKRTKRTTTKVDRIRQTKDLLARLPPDQREALMKELELK